MLGLGMVAGLPMKLAQAEQGVRNRARAGTSRGSLRIAQYRRSGLTPYRCK